MVICVFMATKTLTITEEAYNLLKNVKKDSESFTDAIVRVAKKDALQKLVGILSIGEAERMRKHIKDSRKKMNERVKKIVDRLKG